MTIFEQLNLFLIGRERNLYIRNEDLTLYVRNSMRRLERQLIPCLDIARIEVEDRMQNRGVFTKFMKTLIETHPDVNIFVECIHNPIVIHILEKFDFKKIGTELDVHMYKLKQY